VLLFSIAKAFLTYFFIAVVALSGLAAQSVFPMGEGNPVHIFFAVTFFGAAVVHVIVTAWLHVKAGLLDKVKLKKGELFWIKWKMVFAVSTTLCSTVTMAVLAYDASFHLGDNLFQGPDFIAWMNAPRSALMNYGAFFEYLTCVALFFYFCSYLHDLRNVKLHIASY